jgi:hypothetical protein
MNMASIIFVSKVGKVLEAVFRFLKTERRKPYKEEVFP